MTNLRMALAALVLAACNAPQPTEDAALTETVPALEANASYYGDTIVATGAMSPTEVMQAMANVDSLPAKMIATIEETCQKKGCWMTVALNDSTDMRITFTNYGFFVPTEGAEGKVAVVEGVAYRDTLDVEYLRHMAEDAGQTPEQIAAITEPQVAVNFQADGVIIRN